MRQRLTTLLTAGGIGVVLLSGLGLTARSATASTAIKGSGSSFAGIELQEWAKAVGGPPYNLSVNYQSSSSGAGRQNFADGPQIVDFAVTDIRYNKFDVKPPDPSTFEYIPVTAGGIAMMYNLKKEGFGENATPINLSSLTVCGIFTDAIPYWDDPAIKADNPGVNLPHVAITPIVRSDPAGTNFVMEEYCIALHNDLYARFAATVSQKTSTDYPDEPTSNWPVYQPIEGVSGSENAADTVAGANSDGFITAVETGYAIQRHFPAAAVKNDVGRYVTPTPTAVAKALGYASQQTDGTHQLNFSPGDPAAYNPSTYSYLLVRTTGADPATGAVVTQFADYDLTYGQAGAPSLGYASIGRSLILFGLDRLQHVPGYVAPTSAELAKVPAQDAVPSQTNAQAGSGSTATATSGTDSGSSPTAPAATATSGTPSGPTPSTGTPTPGAGTTRAAGASTATRGTTARSTSAGAGSPASGAAATTDPSATLDPGTGALGQTGVQTNIMFTIGGVLIVCGETLRRRSRRPRSA
ncbi:MAG: substrate-binding domain-containing protein [Acidimicrobiales bacterium]